MLNRPHRLYLLLAVTWIATILFVPQRHWLTLAAGSIIIGVLASAYFQKSASVYATRLLERAGAGDESAKKLYLARARSGFGDLAREYVVTLVKTENENLLPMVVKQLGHPDAQAREMTEDRLARWGTRAAEPVVRAAIGREFSGDGAFRARRLIYRWRPELPQKLTALLDASGYWQD